MSASRALGLVLDWRHMGYGPDVSRPPMLLSELAETDLAIDQVFLGGDSGKRK